MPLCKKSRSALLFDGLVESELDLSNAPEDRANDIHVHFLFSYWFRISGA